MKLLLILLIPFQLLANRPTLYIPINEFYSNPQQEGFLTELIQRLEIKSFEVKFLPFKRAISDYLQDENNNCFAGGDEELSKHYIPNFVLSKYVFSDAYIKVPSRIFSLNEEVCDVSDLKGRSILRIQQFPIEQFIDIKELKHLYDIESSVNAVKMLESKRADFIVTFYADNFHALQKLKYCKSLILLTHLDKFQCHRNPQTEKGIRELNKKIRAFKKSGDLLKLVKKYFKDQYKQFLN
tara:strand:+ start:29266 stop:29982 length:717 start_codon:yes stop_codon:yes gene_type:complete